MTNDVIAVREIEKPRGGRGFRVKSCSRELDTPARAQIIQEIAILTSGAWDDARSATLGRLPAEGHPSVRFDKLNRGR